MGKHYSFEFKEKIVKKHFNNEGDVKNLGKKI